MASTAITVEGLNEDVVLSTRFTTVVRHIDRAESAKQRVELRTSEGRVAVNPARVLLIREVLEPGEQSEGSETPEDDIDDPALDGHKASPFATASA